MKQVLQNLKDGKTIVADVTAPTPKPGQALVRTAASLVSAGTERMLVEFAGKSLLGKAQARPDLARQVLDKARREGLLTALEAAFNRLDQPLPLGYSSAGTVIALGAGVSGFQPGDRVACAGGGWAVHAEVAAVPVNLLARLPDSVDFDSAAFATLGAIAMHGFRLSGAGLGDSVAVIGLGLLGLLTAQIAGAAGCKVLGIDLDPARVELARTLGATAALRPEAEEAAAAFTHSRGADAVLICADAESSDPVELAGEIARERARVVAVGAVGMDVPRRTYYAKELDLVVSRSYGPGRYDPAYEEKGVDYPAGYVRWTAGRNLQAFVDLLGGGQVDVKPLISHRFAIDDAPAAYALITGKTGAPSLGVLLTYPEISAEASTPVWRPGVEALAETSAAPGVLRLGVLGAGNYAGAVLFPALKKLPGLRLVAVASVGGLHAEHARRKFGFARAASDENAVIAAADVDVVAVLTRHHLHAGQTLAALNAGKHVFCEKPLALTEAELSDIEAALAAADAPRLMLGFNRRFAPHVLLLKEFLANSGEPLAMHVRANAGTLPREHWTQDPEQGGGRLLGEAVHFIDLMAYLAGGPPTLASARALPDMGRYNQDNLILTFAFPDGSLGTLHYLANGDKSVPKERLEVFSAGRVAVLDDFRRLALTRDGRTRTHTARLRQDKGHKAAWEAFIASLQTGGPPPIPYAHIFGVHRAALAAVAALRGEG
ncbi:MAG: bi-domain-containing oxidoreductase [Chloroflexi bacterium]|nr:bi-domain-containing oxidoreductase [Chloroflexota bacterium]